MLSSAVSARNLSTPKSRSQKCGIVMIGMRSYNDDGFVAVVVVVVSQWALVLHGMHQPVPPSDFTMSNLFSLL